MNDLNTLLPHVMLHFTISHPTYEECYEDGYEAACAGLSEEENPFTENTKAAAQWLEGWWAGFYEEKPLFSEPDFNLSSKEDTSANDQHYFAEHGHFFSKWFNISSAITATAILGYQLLELVA